MNAFVKKEVRLLLPNFGFACVLALAGLFIPNNPNGIFDGLSYFLSWVFCPAVVAMLALSSFGVEVSAGTFSNLLAQPVSRQKIWETKIALLAATLAAVAILWLVSFLISVFHSGQDHGIKDWPDLLAIVSVTGLVIFSGGLWTVLLLRQVAAAFWFTLLVPGVLLVIVIAIFGGGSDELITAMSVSVLGLYSLAGFFFARWLFFRAQDLQWSGGAIVMPEMRGLARFRSATAVRMWRPRAALWRKEFMLHQSQFVMAFVLAALHLGVLAAPHLYDLNKSRDLKFIIEAFWGLWMVMPLLVGCAAVAEERKIGTLEGQLCLPVKRRTQFAIKIAVALFLSVLLGVVMPLLFEGTRILPDVHFESGTFNSGWQSQMSPAQIDFWLALGMLNGFLPLLSLVGIAVLVGGVAFYVSSLARNTLQSLAPAVLGIMLMCFLLVAAGVPWVREFDFMWRGPLAYFITVPLVLLVLLVLAYGNFQQVRTGLRLGGRNLLYFVAALGLGIAATSAVYHRAWESLTPFEPAHGVARLSAANPAQLNAWWNESSVRLPDGKIWHAQFAPDLNFSPLAAMLGNVKVTLEAGKYYSGSNWVNVQRYGRELIGVKTDGTLWLSEAPLAPTKISDGKWKIADSKMRNLVQFGTETNWGSARPMYLSALLVKNDGTLWRLGTNHFDEKHQQWPGLRAFTPYRLGLDSDWAKVNENYYQFTLQKTNGSIWVSSNGYSYTNGLTPLELEPEFSLLQLYDGSHGKFRSTTQINHGLQYKVGIREDGTFRIWADMSFEKNKKSNNYETVWAAADLQIGGDANWLALAGGGEKVVTLKDDGTLWLWNFRDRPNRGGEVRWKQEVLQTVPVQLGTHSDWISISGASGSLVALAADGSLWFWPINNMEDYYDNRSDRPAINPLLDISRKPQLLGNVFEAPPANANPSANNVSLSTAAGKALLLPNSIPIPVNCPLDASLLNISNTLNGVRVAWYCLSNHSDKGVVVLGDSNSLPYYTLLEYSYVGGAGSIMATNHNLADFFQARQVALAAHATAIFSVQIPAAVNNASLYINYLVPKDDSNGLLHDIKSTIGWPESSTRKSEPYQNFPLPAPYFGGLQK